MGDDGAWGGGGNGGGYCLMECSVALESRWLVHCGSIDFFLDDVW